MGAAGARVPPPLHPHAMAGVAPHSDYQRRPLDRLHRTTYYVAATAFGHTTEWHSFLAAYRVFAGGLSAEEEDRYMAEGAIVGSLLGTPRERVPASIAEARAYFEQVLPTLCMSDAARTAIDFVAHPTPTRETLPYVLPLRVYVSAAVALVPRHLRRLAGIDRPRATPPEPRSTPPDVTSVGVTLDSWP